MTVKKCGKKAAKKDMLLMQFMVNAALEIEQLTDRVECLENKHVTKSEAIESA